MLLLLAGFCLRAEGQRMDGPRRDFDLVSSSDGALHSTNAVGLLSLPLKSVSKVEASFDKGNGKFANYCGSDDDYTLSLSTESYLKPLEKVALYGKVSYENFAGKNMAGSALIDPYSQPFDIVENLPMSPGRKTREMYHLVGAAAWNPVAGFSFGAKIDYTGGNYAKTKDLRHVNTLLDMTVTGGVGYRFERVVELGLNYIYRRSVESLVFMRCGENDKLYNSLVSFGSFYGKQELFGGDQGYSSANTQPLFNQWHGAGLQLSFRLSPRIKWFNELRYLHRSGYYGEKSTSSITYSEHSGEGFEYSTTLSLRKSTTLHLLSLEASYKSLSNHENIYRESTDQATGKHLVQYFGDNEVGTRKTLEIGAAYTLNLGLEGFRPKWVLRAEASYNSRSQKASVYPFYREQSLYNVSLELSLKRNLVKGRNEYSPFVNLGGSFGGTPLEEDGIYIQPSSSQKPPKENAEYLSKEREYLTAPRLAAGVGMRYSHFFNKGLTLYAQAGYSFTEAFRVDTIGHYHGIFNINIGLEF